MTSVFRKTSASDFGTLATGALALPVADAPAAPAFIENSQHPLVTSASWTNTAGGDWGTGSNWSTHVPPNASTAATIAVAGNYTVTITSAEAVQSLTLNNGGVTLSDTSGLSVGTTLALTAGVFQLDNGGAVSGGAISVGAAADFQWNGGYLGVSRIQGTVNINSNYTDVYISGATSFAGAGGSGLATINFSGGNYQTSYLYAQGNFTFNNAVLNLGGGNPYNGNFLYNQDTGSGNATLTLGSNFFDRSNR